MSARIDFHVVHCSSHDSGFPGTELEVPNEKTKGWESARFCEYPQEVILQFQQSHDINQIQILSHQCKIAKRIEILVDQQTQQISSSITSTSTSISSLPTAATSSSSPSQQRRSTLPVKPIRWEDVTFDRIGYLSLDSNERSSFRARELKSVYLNAQAKFIKFVIHENHTNKVNLFNQVGIVALSVIGIGAKTSKLLSFDEIPLNLEFDNITGRKIYELTEAKKNAVEIEDYDEAKRLKSEITYLKMVGSKLMQLDRKKKAAIEKEDYDLAKEIKQEMDEIRDQPATSSIGAVNWTNPKSLQENRNHLNRQSFSRRSLGGDGGHSRPQSSSMMGQNPGENRKILPVDETWSQLTAPSPTLSGHQQHDNSSSYDHQIASVSSPPLHDDHSSPSVSVSQRQTEFIDVDEQQIRPRSSDPLTEKNPFNTNTPLKLKGEDDLPEPEELHGSNRQEAQSLIDLFGEYPIRCLYSQIWNLRVKGLEEIISSLDSKDKTESPLFLECCRILKMTISDRVAQVFLTSMNLLEKSMKMFSPAKAEAAEENGHDAQDMKKNLSPIVNLIVDKLGESNARVSKSAKDMLMNLSHLSGIGPSLVCHAIQKPLKSKTAPRPLKGRGLIMLELVKDFRLSQESGLTIEGVVKLIKLQIEHKDKAIRSIAIELAAEVYDIVRSQLIPHLEGLRPPLKASLNSAFQMKTGDRNVLPVPLTSSKEQNRPSKKLGFERPKSTKRPQQKLTKKGKEKQKQKWKKKKKKRNAGKINSKKSDPLGERGGRDVEEEKVGNGAKIQSTTPTSTTAAEMSTAQHSQISETVGSSQHRHAQGGSDSRQPHELDHLGDDDSDYEEQIGFCQFCDLTDPSFEDSEESLDLHYWQNCAMLTSCPYCEQVIEISSLNEHLFQECEESRGRIKDCPRCKEAVDINKFDSHVAAAKCRPVSALDRTLRCPLCHKDIAAAGEEGWKLHLLRQGCNQNPRPRNIA